MRTRKGEATEAQRSSALANPVNNNTLRRSLDCFANARNDVLVYFFFIIINLYLFAYALSGLIVPFVLFTGRCPALML
ncbi:MAG: hypothetical protein LBH30_07250 [Prevotellaceae bacterium]|nr:hypothetical protein [Prevotellaceae bacterium]